MGRRDKRGRESGFDGYTVDWALRYLLITSRTSSLVLHDNKLKGSAGPYLSAIF